MASVNTNYGASIALQNLNKTNSELERTQNRINTGMKVSSAKDSGAIFAIATSQRANAASQDAVRAGLQKLALGGWNLAAGDDLDAWVHVSSAERDEDVRGIVGQDGGQHTGTGDTGGLQNRLIGGWAFRLSGALT